MVGWVREYTRGLEQAKRRLRWREKEIDRCRRRLAEIHNERAELERDVARLEPEIARLQELRTYLREQLGKS